MVTYINPNTATLRPGTKVRVVNHPSYPTWTFNNATIVRKSGEGYVVRFECFGRMVKETLYPRALEVV